MCGQDDGAKSHSFLYSLWSESPMLEALRDHFVGPIDLCLPITMMMRKLDPHRSHCTKEEHVESSSPNRLDIIFSLRRLPVLFISVGSLFFRRFQAREIVVFLAFSGYQALWIFQFFLPSISARRNSKQHIPLAQNIKSLSARVILRTLGVNLRSLNLDTSSV